MLESGGSESQKVMRPRKQARRQLGLAQVLLGDDAWSPPRPAARRRSYTRVEGEGGQEETRSAAVTKSGDQRIRLTTGRASTKTPWGAVSRE